jgi:hypothetical protein
MNHLFDNASNHFPTDRLDNPVISTSSVSFESESFRTIYSNGGGGDLSSDSSEDQSSAESSSSASAIPRSNVSINIFSFLLVDHFLASWIMLSRASNLGFSIAGCVFI